MSAAHEGPMYRLGWIGVIFGALSLPVALVAALFVVEERRGVRDDRSRSHNGHSVNLDLL